MSVDNSTVPEFRAVEINTLALDVTRFYALAAGTMAVKVSLSSLSFGLLTILSLTSVYLLLRQGSSVSRTNIRIPLVSTALLYVSTGTYIAALAWNQSSTIRWVARAADGLFSSSYHELREVPAFQQVVRRQSWMETAATLTTFIIGDAVVWWRVSVVFQHKVVYCMGPLLLTLSLVFCIIGMYMSSRAPSDMTGLVEFISGNAYAYTAVFLSLATNIIATSLIAYKAWEHRQLVKKQFAAAGTRSQVLQALALLVESGSMYCVLMTFAAVYEIDPVPSQAGAGLAFSDVGQDITHGCIIPLAAIYPAVIIVLVALRRSPIDTVQACSLGLVREDTPSTFTLHHAPSRSSAGTDVEGAGAVDGISAGDRRRARSLELVRDVWR